LVWLWSVITHEFSKLNIWTRQYRKKRLL